MDKTIKTVLILVVIIVIVCTGYYFGVSVPHKQLAENQEQCSQIEGSIKNHIVETYTNPSAQFTSNNHFNTSLKKCIVEVTAIFSQPENGNSTYIYDGFANQELASTNDDLDNPSLSSYYDDVQKKEITADQFKTLENNYMSQ